MKQQSPVFDNVRDEPHPKRQKNASEEGETSVESVEEEETVLHQENLKIVSCQLVAIR